MKFSWSRANSLWVLVAVLLLSFSMGCRTKSQDETTSNGDGPSDGQHTEEPLEPLEGEPTVDFWDWDQTQKAVHQNNGQVVVLYAWGLWNETLDSPDLADKIEKEKKEELLSKVGFDEFVDLKKRFRDEIVALSLNTDYGYEVEEKEGSPDALKEKVLQFVTKHGANFQHGISNLPEEVLYFDEDKLNTKAPATLVYDKSGKLRETFPKKVEGEEGKYEPYSFHDDVIPLVKTLVAEKYEPSKSVTNEENADANKSSTSNESKDIEGCVEPPIEKTKNSGDGDSAQSDKVSVEIDNWEGLQERVKKAKGKVVVVDLWSTQCVPCLKEYPHLVKLHNERKAEVACLSFNLDFYGVGTPEELKPDVLAVLKKLNSTLPNFMSKLEDEKVYEQLKLASIPAVYVYDRNGKLQKRFDDTQGQFTYEKDILPLVETLIKEKK